MGEFFSKLFDTSDYPARWSCGNWSAGEGWLHILSDIGTWSAYTAIPIVLLYFTFKRNDFPFTKLFGLFAAFILLCGTVHLVEAVIFWYPIYRISGLLKLATALVSWVTVIALIRYTPQVLHLPSVATTNKQLVKEIEQRKEVESELRWMQARYEAFLNGTSSIIWITDPQGKFIAPQSSWQRFTGQNWNNHQGDGWLNAVLPEDRSELSTFWNSPAQGNSCRRIQGHIWHAESQSFRPVIFEAVPVLDSSGQVLEWVGTVSDIHEQRVAEESLSAAEAAVEQRQRELELIYESAPVGMSLIDREFRYVRINETHAQMNGIPRKAQLGKKCNELLPGIASTIQPLYEHVFKTGQPVKNHEVYEINSERSDRRCWLMNFYPLSNDKGEVWAVSCIIQDITDRKIMEESLRESEQRAMQANLAKSEFLANMSHEIRTPMAAILGYADILSERLQDTDCYEYVVIIKRNGRYLIELINDILDLSRIEAGKLEFDIEPVSLPDFVNEIQTLMQVRADEKNLLFHILYTGKVPETIQTDSTRLRQVLINLIGNAIKFTERGEVQLIIRMISSAEAPEIEFTVQDTGIGISDKQQSHLFKPFAQGDASVTREYGGTGLGLAISRRLVEMLNGTIEVESELGQGSIFHVRLPLGSLEGIALVEPGQIFHTSQVSVPPDNLPRLNCRVLVVDDRREIRYICQHFLEKSGATVITAEDGQQGVDVALAAREAGNGFQVILMDLQMPRVDGLKAVAQLRSHGFETPIIALTADAMKGDRERCLNGGYDNYLSKPIDRAVMLEMVWKYAQHVSAHKPYIRSQEQ
jgi:PAS domain S-box-containing protein